MYIALELCLGSLQDLIEQPPLSVGENPSLSDASSDNASMQLVRQQLHVRTMLLEIASGLQHLHRMKIVHRDIKPQNILIATPQFAVSSSSSSSAPSSSSSSSSFRLLISDFGLCKKLADDQSSFNHTARFNGGTMGWRAPETIRALPPANSAAQMHMQILNESLGSTSTSSSYRDDDDDYDNSTGGDNLLHRVTRSVDVFSAGLVYFYLLSNGLHPYGDRFIREINILADKKDLSALIKTAAQQPSNPLKMAELFQAEHLISEMLARDPQNRPTFTQVLCHPFFWPSAKRLQFLLDVSDRLDVEDRQTSLVIADFESPDVAGQIIPAEGWQRKVDRLLYENLGKYRKYSSNSLQDLLRALRNKVTKEFFDD